MKTVEVKMRFFEHAVNTVFQQDAQDTLEEIKAIGSTCGAAQCAPVLQTHVWNVVKSVLRLIAVLEHDLSEEVLTAAERRALKIYSTMLPPGEEQTGQGERVIPPVYGDIEGE